MKIISLLLVATTVLLLVIAGCSRKGKTTLDEDKTRAFPLNEKTSLGIDETTSTDNGKLTITALSAKDSRCPKGVNCIRAGEVFVDFKLKANNKEEKISMATPSTKKEGGYDRITFEGYIINLHDVTPYPVMPKPEEEEETAILISVSRGR